jgi:hypothetical protein
MWLDNDMAAHHSTNTGNAGERTVAMNVDLTTVEGFTAARAAWKAAGCPSDHPYLTAEMPKAEIVPLVGGITTEMVAAAAAMRPLMPERSAWR